MAEKLLFLGDWFITEHADASSVIGDWPFIFNLEAPISTRGMPTSGKINLRMEKNRIVECFGRSPIAVCLANNHIADFGNDAFTDTLNELHALGISFFGAGSLDDNFHNPAIIDVGAQRVALLGYVCPSANPIFASDQRYGVCPISLDRFQSDYRLAKSKDAAKVVVCLHWGVEDIRLPKPHDIALAHQIIEQGADLIVGHHAHVPQPVETYRGKIIAYGLGNFMMRDLNLPRYVAAGELRGTYQKQNTLWNKVSLGLLWDAATGYADVLGLYFDGSQVARRRVGGKKNTHLTRLYYPIWFQFRLRQERIQHVLLMFLRKPWRLRPRHVESLLRTVLRTRV